MHSDPARTGCIGHCMGGRLLIPFAADHPSVKAIVLYYPSVRDEPETSHRPRHAFHLAKTLQCASLVFGAGLDYIATPAIQGPLWQSFITNGKLVEWHFFSDANHGFRHPDNAGFQPYYADLTWPLTTSFLQRTV
jgi:dienelactone hydrolase